MGTPSSKLKWMYEIYGQILVCWDPPASHLFWFVFACFVFVDVAIQGEALTTIHMHPQGLVYGRLLDIPNATFMMYMFLLQGCERITLPSLWT